MSNIENNNNYWALRCKLNDAHKFVTPEEVARFRKDYADVFRSYKDENGLRVYTDEEVQFEAYEYYDDKEIATFIHQGQTPKGLADTMTM